MSFSSLGLSAPLINAVQERAYSEPTPVQSAAIPAILAGRDVLASAQTGSGKTAAFCLPLLQTLTIKPRGARGETRAVQILILVPTRELATQVGETLRILGQHLPQPVKLAVLFGGISINPQMMHLRGGADIVIATPGRLLDLVSHNALQLSSVRSLVLDEADRLLELGFADELSRVLSMLPLQRQNLFFSATFSPQVDALATSMLHDPVQIAIATTAESAPDIVQRAIVVDARQRTQLLRHLISTEKWSRVLVFVATKYAADLISTKLRRADINAEAFHGEQSQGKRSQVLSDFKASRLKVVIATDVAARGIDVSQLPVVVNYDLPRSSDDYTHRIGRTGRAGESGLAISFICADSANEAHFRLIEQRHQLRVAREQIPGFEPAFEAAASTAGMAVAVSDPNGGIKGKRPSKKDKLRALAAKSE
ncbi:DEAD/DEAH box helicase [Undibacterium sp. Jales W-56]|uniref:DEAD/DEAH box helicase n=1 Tax=Undibacterium sp. Jales W-56 TaxID=2897325 RepID=UPI0021D10E53|nr:DEAD/DEAH box helicase [Undibacterium sp. Jales W-56]MCU6433577.1 DEAD/DEAH box helicase [Undibacterium sp. Jales W-56]